MPGRFNNVLKIIFHISMLWGCIQITSWGWRAVWYTCLTVCSIFSNISCACLDLHPDSVLLPFVWWSTLGLGLTVISCHVFVKCVTQKIATWYQVALEMRPLKCFSSHSLHRLRRLSPFDFHHLGSPVPNVTVWSSPWISLFVLMRVFTQQRSSLALRRSSTAHKIPAE